MPLEVGEVDVAVVRDVREAHDQVEVVASSSHGATLPSWSRRVTTISSPAFHPRAAVRESANSSEVMFAPNITSSAVQPRKRPAAARASSTSATVRALVSNGPPTLAFDSRR